MNNVNIGGYLVSKPDGTPTRDGLPRVKFVVALNHPNKTAPDYIRCVAWGERTRDTDNRRIRDFHVGGSPPHETHHY
jgi:single-stranded DNA-binding protein